MPKKSVNAKDAVSRSKDPVSRSAEPVNGSEGFFAAARFFPQWAGGLEALAGFQTANLDALRAASATALKGFETWSEELVAYNLKAAEESMAGARKLLDCRTVQQAAELQAELARSRFESMVAQGSRLSHLAMKLASDMVQPIQSRFEEATGEAGRRLTA